MVHHIPIAQPSTLAILDLSGCNVILDFLPLLCKNLRSLLLPGCGLDQVQAYLIADFLLSNAKLEELHLQDNPNMGFAGLSAICRALALTNRTVKYLDIQGCLLSDDLEPVVAQMVSRNTSLKYLILDRMVATWPCEALMRLSGAFNQNTGLRIVGVPTINAVYLDLFSRF